MHRRLYDWLLEQPFFQRFTRHRKEFKYIWVLILLVACACLLVRLDIIEWSTANVAIKILLCFIAAQFLLSPMNAVYGLMGTSGSIRMFFLNFLFITALFAGVYYWAFFKNAGISYDVNQPHIDFACFCQEPNDSTCLTEATLHAYKISEKYDTLYFERQIDTISFRESIVRVTRDTLHYQRIDFFQVWRNSILTTLTQEPAELLTAATVHNDGMQSNDVHLDQQRSALLEWVLIFHIIISWIFFGVFISLLYSKFRYES